MRQSHDIEYTIHGSDIQYVEVILDPGEVMVAEAGALMYMQQGIQMETRMSDGSEKNSGVLGGIIGAAKRHFTGEKFFLTHFTNRSNQRLSMAFSTSYPGSIIPIDLMQHGGSIYCEKEGFVCSAKGVEINAGLTKHLTAGMFGGEGYILQKLEGDGIVFVHAGGSVMRRDLRDGEQLYVDTGSVVAFQHSVGFDVQTIRGIKNMLFGGENIFITTLRGPGTVWIQSLPYDRMVAHIYNTIVTLQNKKRK